MVGPPRVLTENWRLKLAALGLSIFLWALVQTEPVSQETFSAVPVTVSVQDTSWSLSGPPSPSTVELRLGGPAREIIRLAREGTSLDIPVEAVGSRDTAVSLQREWVQLGQRAGVTVESMSPAIISLSFEPAVSRSVPLALRVRGELPPRLALSSELGLSPSIASVRGPDSRLQGLDSLPLVPFDLDGVRESGVFVLRVDTAGLGGVVVDPAEVTLGVRVEPMEERILDEVVVHAGMPPGDQALVVDPPTIQLRLTGARTLVAAMDLSLLQVAVSEESLRNLQPGEVRRVRPVIAGLPALISAFPSVDLVSVRRAVESPSDVGRDRP